jgi:hypothetical protein
MANYIAKLNDKKTYKAGLIDDIQEYAFKSIGPIKIPPRLPRANEDRHVIAIEFRGDQPSIFTVLDAPGKEINPVYGSADKLLFVFVNMKSHILRIESPIGGYRLADDQQIGAAFQVGYRISDAGLFWKTANDPLDEFESTVIQEARDYFTRITSNYLVSFPFDSKRALEQHLDVQLNVVKGELEDSIRRSSFPGITIEKIYADITLSQELKDFWRTPRTRGLVDLQITRDQTFSPYSLREVIRVIDRGLLENFYSMPWSDAMYKVHERLTEVKREYLEQREQQKNAKITKLQRSIQIAIDSRLDETSILRLKAQLEDELMQIVADVQPYSPSNNEFLQHLIDSPKTTGQLAGGSPKQISSTRGDAS